MDELTAAPSSTEPTAEELASIAMGTNSQEAGATAVGESTTSIAKTANAGSSASDASSSTQLSHGSTAGEAESAGASAVLQSPSTSDAGSSDAPHLPEEPVAGSDGGDAPTIHSDLAGAISDAVLTGTCYYRIDGEDAEPAIDPVAHLSRLDAMLAELERKLALGIHTFAHEITAARDHLAKLL
ncbi:hypothetical protein [Burkholderia cepacia]|uniref:hypothetical protein n=1 Tax=Burkholderia cepacia TaxID=292 RepID=UPI002AB0D674|nr:hypothetical protein [Burkholderia cepacia]